MHGKTFSDAGDWAKSGAPGHGIRKVVSFELYGKERFAPKRSTLSFLTKAQHRGIIALIGLAT